MKGKNEVSVLQQIWKLSSKTGRTSHSAPQPCWNFSKSGHPVEINISSVYFWRREDIHKYLYVY